MDEEYHDYTVQVPSVLGQIYFSVETYYHEMMPAECVEGIFSYQDSVGQTQSLNVVNPVVYWEVRRGNTQIYDKFYAEQYAKPLLVSDSDYSANDVFKIAVQYKWINAPIKDYTVRMYSRMDVNVNIEDSDQKT